MGRRLLVVLAALGLLAVPATPAPGSPMGSRVMYLTFDDGPNPLFTPIVLRLLDQHAARATFFPTGRTLGLFWGDEEVQDLLDRGHAVGSHSWEHQRLPDLPQADLERDLARANAALEARTGYRPTCVRAPYGITDPGVERTFDEMHLALVGWDADPEEWSSPSIEEALAHVRRWEEDGMVVLLHDRKWQTIGILRALLERYADEGWVFEPLPECIPESARAGRSATRTAGDSPIGGVAPLWIDGWSALGWAHDPDAPDGGLEVVVNIDGQPQSVGTTGEDGWFVVTGADLGDLEGPACLWVRNHGPVREDAFLGCHRRDLQGG